MDHGPFEPPECRLSLRPKKRRHRAAGPALNFMVCVHEPIAEALSQSPAYRRLTRPHESDQDDVLHQIFLIVNTIFKTARDAVMNAVTSRFTVMSAAALWEGGLSVK